MFNNSPTRYHNIQASSVLSSSSNLPQTLTHKILECNMRKNNQQYQQLLILQKEAQLKLFQQSNKNKNKLKEFDKMKKKVEGMNIQLKKLKEHKNKQQHYLKEYYQFLDQKLKLGAKSILLYAGLQKLDEQLNKNYEQEKDSLEKSLEALQNQASNLMEELEKLNTKREFLKQEFEITKIEKQAENSQLIRKRAAEKKKRQDYFKQLQFYSKGISQLKAQKQMLQDEQSSLKKARNLEQVHKKHWLSIQNAIKKQFTYRMKAKNYKQTIALEYKMKLPEMETSINNKKYERDILADQIDQRKRKVQDIKSVLNFSMNRISKVSTDMINRSSTS